MVTKPNIATATVRTGVHKPTGDVTVAPSIFYIQTIVWDQWEKSGIREHANSCCK